MIGPMLDGFGECTSRDVLRTGLRSDRSDKIVDAVGAKVSWV